MTQNEIDEEIGNMSMILSYAIQMRGNKPFKNGLIRKVTEYRQSLRYNPEQYLKEEAK